MLLLTKPPYLRWAIATLLVVAALAWDVADRSTEAVPFAMTAIRRGEPITDGAIEWRQVPTGTLKTTDLEGAHARTDIQTGDPITASVAGPPSKIPDSWWSIPIDLPVGTPVGARARLAFLDGSSVDGIVSLAPVEDQFGITSSGAVAVPETRVNDVAVASASDTLLVVIAP